MYLDLPSTSATTMSTTTITISAIPVSSTTLLLHTRPVWKAATTTSGRTLAILSRGPLLHNFTQFLIISHSPTPRIFPRHLWHSTAHDLRHDIYWILIAFSAVASAFHIYVTTTPMIWTITPTSIRMAFSEGV